MRLTLTLLLIGVLGLSACGGSSKGEEPAGDYTPVADRELYSQVEALPGVRRVDVGYSDSFGNSNIYQGEIQVADDADLRDILDRAIAILRQGAPDATMGLTVYSSTASVTPRDLDLGTAADLEQRYGPQPGTGEPPS